MRKRVALIIFINFCCIFSIYSQLLNDTKWIVYEPTGGIFIFVHFANDTMYFGNTTMTNLIAGTFSENYNNFTMTDLQGGPPCFNSTGNYTFLLRNDTLIFTLINDPCDSRIYTFTIRRWIAWTEGVDPDVNLQGIQIYPNPSQGLITVSIENPQLETEYLIYDQLGRNLWSGKLNKYQIIDIKDFSNGIYFLRSKRLPIHIYKIIKI